MHSVWYDKTWVQIRKIFERKNKSCLQSRQASCDQKPSLKDRKLVYLPVGVLFFELIYGRRAVYLF